jgi:hypothetical protein
MIDRRCVSINQFNQSINQCCFAARVPAFFKHALPYRPLQVLGAAAAAGMPDFLTYETPQRRLAAKALG